jgi:hypothetical protein
MDNFAHDRLATMLFRSLNGLNGWNGMAVLNRRDVAAEQACALLNVALREILFFTYGSQAIAN